MRREHHVEASARNLLQCVPISGTKMDKPFCKLYHTQYKLWNLWYIMTICSLRPFLKFTKSSFCCVASSAQTRSVYFRSTTISRMHTIFKYTTTAKEIVYDKSWEYTSLVLDFSLLLYQTSLVLVYSPSHNVLKLKQANALPSEVNAGTKQGTLGTNTESCITTQISWLSDEEETLISSVATQFFRFWWTTACYNGTRHIGTKKRIFISLLFQFNVSWIQRCPQFRGLEYVSTHLEQ